MKKENFIALIGRYLDGSASLEEENLVEAYLNELEKGPVKIRTGAEEEAIKIFMQKRINLEMRVGKGKVISAKIWSRVAAAIAVMLILAAGSYFLFFNKKQKSPEIVKTTLPHDVNPPATNRAMIILANGQKVFLDSTANGTVAIQNNINLVKTGDGKIVYESHQLTTDNSPLTYNTLTNPRGSKVIDMTLSDGTHVWLNAGSSVTYPVAFVGNERKVSITGEAYFEVSHDASKAFIVSKGDMNVTVLGTHFNVNAYDDEHAIKVTLLEGSVKISHRTSHDSRIIKPGEQAIIDNSHPMAIGMTIDNNVDLDEVMAWKNGFFSFNGADIETIMRDVSRWYDVDVVYEGKIPSGHYKGKPSRNLTASQMLKLIEYAGVKFRIEGKKIIVE